MAAINLFILNIIGLGLGPVGVGFISDLAAPEYGIESIRYGRLATLIVLAWGALHEARVGVLLHRARGAARAGGQWCGCSRTASSAPDYIGRLTHLAYITDDFAYKPVFHGFLSTHPIIALGIFTNTIPRLAGALGDNSINAFPRLENFPGMYLNICRVATETATGLMN